MMFKITLGLTEQKTKASDSMAAHNKWIARGVSDGLSIFVGGLKPQGGGVIPAHNADRPTIEARVVEYPFVRGGIVTSHIQEVSPARIDPGLAFLMDGADGSGA